MKDFTFYLNFYPVYKRVKSGDGEERLDNAEIVGLMTGSPIDTKKSADWVDANHSTVKRFACVKVSVYEGQEDL